MALSDKIDEVKNLIEIMYSVIEYIYKQEIIHYVICDYAKKIFQEQLKIDGTDCLEDKNTSICKKDINGDYFNPLKINTETEFYKYLDPSIFNDINDYIALKYKKKEKRKNIKIKFNVIPNQYGSRRMAEKDAIKSYDFEIEDSSIIKILPEYFSYYDLYQNLLEEQNQGEVYKKLLNLYILSRNIIKKMTDKKITEIKFIKEYEKSIKEGKNAGVFQEPDLEHPSDYIEKVKGFVRKLNLNSHIRKIIEDEEKNLDTELRSKIFDQITKLKDYSDIGYSDYKNYTMDIEPRTYNLHDSYAKMKIVYNKVINDETIEFFSDEINYHKQGAELERLKRERAEEEEEKESHKQFRMEDTEV